MAGFQQGVREELRGGGIIRSAGGRKKLAARAKKDWERGDERILGNGSFVENILKKFDKKQTRDIGDMDTILAEVCRITRVPQEQILSKNRVRQVSAARRQFFLRAHEEAGVSYTTLGRICGLAHTSVKQAIAKARVENKNKNN